MKKFSRTAAMAVLVLGGTLATSVTVDAGGYGGSSGSSYGYSYGNTDLLGGADFSLQNYFNAAGELTPFFDQIDGTVGGGVEIKKDYIYDINLSNRAITMKWNKAPEFDQFEPYVGALSGISQEEAAAAPIADEYHFTFDTDISDFRFSAKTNRSLQPETRIEGTNTLIIAIPGGTDIGDGFNAKITVQPPVRNIRNLDFSLQNYFNAAGDLTPFFDQIDGTVGRGTEIKNEYIYDINLSNRSIKMEWNKDPQFDMFEPYVGALSGITQEQAAASPIADEYHFTFSEKVSHLNVVASWRSDIVPETRFEDDYTLVIAIPGGTDIGDGIGLRVWLI